MTPHLLDTNILSELKRPRPSHRVTVFVNTSQLADLYISAVTLAEIRFGIESSPESSRRAELELWLANTIRPMFQDRVLQVTENVMLRWRHLVENGRKTGRTFAQPDLTLAATAMEHGMVLVTRNVRDFAGIDMLLFNPWDEQA